MKTFLSVLALALAAAIPATLVVASAGLALPAALHATPLVSAFATTLIILLAVADYGRPIRLTSRAPRAISGSTPVPVSTRATYPLAA